MLAIQNCKRTEETGETPNRWAFDRALRRSPPQLPEVLDPERCQVRLQLAGVARPRLERRRGDVQPSREQNILARVRTPDDGRAGRAAVRGRQRQQDTTISLAAVDTAAKVDVDPGGPLLSSHFRSCGHLCTAQSAERPPLRAIPAIVSGWRHEKLGGGSRVASLVPDLGSYCSRQAQS